MSCPHSQPAFFDWRSLSPSLHPDTDALFDPGRTRVAYTGDGFTEGEYGSGKQRFGDTDKQTYGLPPQMPAMEGLGQQQLRTPSEGKSQGLPQVWRIRTLIGIRILGFRVPGFTVSELAS